MSVILGENLKNTIEKASTGIKSIRKSIIIVNIEEKVP